MSAGRAARSVPVRALVWALVLAAIAAALVYAVLAVPNRPSIAWTSLFWPVPAEFPVVVAALLLAPAGRAGWLVRICVTAVLAALLIVKVADMSMYAALNRPFNLAVDLPLLHAGWMLISGTSGGVRAALYVAGGLVGLILAVMLLGWAGGRIARLSPVRRGGRLAIAAAGAAALALVAANLAGYGTIAAFSAASSRLVRDHAVAAIGSHRAILALAQEAAEDPVAGVRPPRLLSGLAGRDIVFAFVESYGRSNHDNPLYAATTRDALNEVGTVLSSRGLAARSAWLTSPTYGGQSWLAHATMLSGLWIDNQGRYDGLMRSPRRTILDLARDAGWESVAVMPAITMAWPEQAYFGYDRVYAARDLGYRGLPFNWVTMPDQFTWSAFQRLALDPRPRKPVVAEIALISSHAPWTPIPSLIDWNTVGDGSVFDAQARSGDTPEVVWRDHDRVRDQFRQSIDYALRTIGSFLGQYDGAAPVVVVLGDHQPAVFVSGSEDNRDVPIHIIGPPDVLRAIDGWGWSEGLLPDDVAPVWRMDAFRQRFIEAFSGTSEHPGAPPA